MNAEEALQLEDVNYSYSSDSSALQGVNLSLKHGDFLALLGPNGGGKTTLLKIMLGLLAPDSGTVRVYGEPPRNMRANIGYVPQFATTNCAFPISALDLVLSGAARSSSWRGAFWDTKRERREEALRLLEDVGLPSKGGESYNSLSGGQRQRVLVARALMGRHALPPEAPFLLLLDEPTANIDPSGKFCFYEYLGSLRGKISIILVSHDLTLVSPFFSSIALVNRTMTLVDKGHSEQSLSALLGSHEHECPVGDLLEHARHCVHSKV